MKKYSAMLAAVAAVALCFSAQAITYSPLTVTITGVGGTSPGAILDITSTVATITGGYDYSYAVTVPSIPAGVTLGSVSVYFDTGLATVSTITGGTGFDLNPGNVEWLFSPETPAGTYTLSFDSPDAPGYGQVGGYDTTSWPNTGGVYVPNVPDGGLTLAMVGCVFMGIAGIRSRLGKRA